MTSPADILRNFLVTEGLVAEVGTDVAVPWQAFVSHLPNVPEDAVCLYDTAGRLDGRMMDTGEQIEHPGIQLVFRSGDYLALWEKVNAVVLALDRILRQLVAIESGTYVRIHSVSRAGSPNYLGIDEMGDRRRHLVSVNVTVTLHPET